MASQFSRSGLIGKIFEGFLQLGEDAVVDIDVVCCCSRVDEVEEDVGGIFEHPRLVLMHWSNPVIVGRLNLGAPFALEVAYASKKLDALTREVARRGEMRNCVHLGVEIAQEELVVVGRILYRGGGRMKIGRNSRIGGNRIVATLLLFNTVERSEETVMSEDGKDLGRHFGGLCNYQAGCEPGQ